MVEEKNEEKAWKAHVLMLGFPGYGHITPMIQFARRLAWKGIRVTFATSLSAAKSIQTGTHLISVLSTYDDIKEGGLRGPGGLLGFLQRFQNSTTKTLLDLIRKSLDKSDERMKVKWMVYDCDLQWGLDIAKEMGIQSAAFLAQTLGSTAAYYMLNQKVKGEKLVVPPLDIPDFSNTGVSAAVEGEGLHKISPILRQVLTKFDNFGRADCMFSHTFDTMEHENRIEKPIRNNFEPRSQKIGPNKPDSKTCLQWLNTKEPNSAVYIAFGSVTDLNPKQMKEMAMALKNLSCNFLWVLKETEMPYLPLNFIEETSEKGMFVTWCPQLQVLSHPAVGYTITHCGANSLMEAIVFEVPMVGMPKLVDQIPNSYFAEKVWKVGIEATEDEEGVCSKEEIERCLRELMFEEKGREIKKNIMKLKKCAKEAVSEGGSSDRNINDFISRIVSGAFQV